MSTAERATSNEYGAPDRWWVLSLVALNYFTLIIHRQVLYYVQPPLVEELTLSDTQVGWLQTAFLVPYAFSQLFVGYLGDRFRRRTVLLFSLLGSVVFLGSSGFIRTYEELFTTRVLMGFAQAASVPAIAGIMADCFTSRNRSLAVGIYFVSLNLGVMVAGKYGGRCADLESIELPLWILGMNPVDIPGWRFSLVMFGLMGLVTAFLIFLFLREPDRTERATGRGLGTEGSSLWGTVRSVLTVRTFMILSVVFIVHVVVLNARDLCLARYFHDNFKMSNEEAGQYATFPIQLSTIAGLLLGGFLGDRLGRTMRAGRTWILLVGTAIWIPSLYLIGTSQSLDVIFISMIVFGIGAGLYVANLWTTAFEVIDPAARSTAIGMYNVIGGVGGFTGAVIGVVVENDSIGLGGTLAILSVAPLLGVLLLLINISFLLRHDYRGPAS